MYNSTPLPSSSTPPDSSSPMNTSVAGQDCVFFKRSHKKSSNVCPRSLDPFYIVTSYIKEVKIFWTHSTKSCFKAMLYMTTIFLWIKNLYNLIEFTYSLKSGVSGSIYLVINLLRWLQYQPDWGYHATEKLGKKRKILNFQLCSMPLKSYVK